MSEVNGKEVVEQARERFKLCQDHDSDERRLQLDDLRFLDGEQWPGNTANERATDGRPALVVNRMDQFVQQITNNMRQSRIAGRVFPVDDKSDPDTAEIIQGLIRHIEYNSDAELAYSTAAFYAVAMGWGAWRLKREYCDPYSFDQIIKIERFRNPFQVYFDPHHTHPTGKDSKYGFVVTSYSKDDYKREFKETSLAGIEDWSGLSENCGDWVTEDEVRVAEYYVIEYTDDTLVRLADGRAVLKSEMKAGDRPALDADGKAMERATSVPVVKWYKLNGHEVLDETVWPTSPKYPHIPLIKVTGNELDVAGKAKLKGIIRNLKDAQRQYNFMLSAQAEAIDLDKGQIIVGEGQLEGHEGEWSQLSKRKVLRVKDTLVDGKVAPRPSRIPSNGSVQAMTEARLMAADDLKALTGIYDAALGAQSNETSGIAINSRQAQSDTANYHFTGNLVRSINHSGRLTLGAIPKVYDTPRTVKIVGEEGHDVAHINQIFQDGEEGQSYSVTIGEYDVVFEAGPSQATKQQQDAQMMTEIIKVAPGLMDKAPDLILKAVGAPMELVDRVRPPQPDDAENLPPAAQQKLQEQDQMIQQLQAELQKASNPLEAKKLDLQAKQLEIESRERVELARLDNERLALQAKLDSAEAIALLKAEVDAIKAGQQLDAQAAAAEAGAGAQQM